MADPMRMAQSRLRKSTPCAKMSDMEIRDDNIAEARRTLRFGMLGLFAMMLLAAAIGGLVYQQVVRGANAAAAANENSTIEHLQLAFVVMSAGATSLVATLRPDGRRGFALTAAFFLSMAIRECDGYLDAALFHGSWFPLAIAVAVLACAYAATGCRNATAGLVEIVRDRSFGVLCAGLSMLLVFSRILGHKDIWHSVSRSVTGFDAPIQLVRSIKNTAEEGTELFGYALIFFWAASFAFAALRRRGGAGNAD